MIVRFFDWDQPRNVSCDLSIKKGEVIVDHEWGTFLAEILIADKNIEGDETVGRVKRKASPGDVREIKDNQKKEKEILREAKNQARALELPMKIIDARISIDGSCVVIAFVADGRVDFRSMVKNLSTKFGKSVRLQQIGSRDEARRCGGYGICGKELCCMNSTGGLKSISTEMARCQLISHRGSDRISGLCGRLMCCLAYEADQYEESLGKLPPKGTKVKVDGKIGEVIDLQAMSQKVKVRLEDGTEITVEKEKAKTI